VVIGIDPAKRSHAMAVLDGSEQDLAVLSAVANARQRRVSPRSMRSGDRGND
jgi:hypothetical protein